jgi:hypothetical protein
VKKHLLDYALKIRLPITLFTIIASFALTYFIARPERDGIGYSPEQPIKFSHRLHAGTMGIDCKYCHSGVSEGRHATIPAASTCVNCHSVARRDKPEIVKLFDYYDNNKPIPWKRIHKVPDYAYFNHSVHVNKGLDCKACHGKIENMDLVGQMESFTMGSCLNCHRDPHKRMPDMKMAVKNGPDNCFACHR